jgi:F0F1-type ATP synthase membrane subunit a
MVPVILVLFLFVIFTNHLPYIMGNITETTLHADDAKLHKTITRTTDFKYLGLLQNLINQI